MRIVLVSGFLGSGKTSLLIPMIDYLDRQNQRNDLTDNARKAQIAIIENEIGSINLDSRMLEGKGLEMREMLSGCICCSLQDNLALEITELAETINPRLLLIEATGLASAREVIQGIRSAVDAKYYTSIDSLVVVDASRLAKIMDKAPSMVQRQFEHLDVLLLNKLDLVSEQEKDQVLRLLQKVIPDARVVEVSAQKGIPDATWSEVFESLKTR